ncbi:hypothetical protein HDF16_005562 [Granulicella aggregans]|uniref:Uncharacterized protein n=1 Tax=Granulicella aggregans TaxID=474949 RepID=A0A7W8E6M2_9BACT|nr:hypothetical protein [Granulicella aggregans]
MVNLTNGMVRITRGTELPPSLGSTAPTYTLEGLDGFRATCYGFDKVETALRDSFIFKNEDLKVARLVLDYNPRTQVALDATPI